MCKLGGDLEELKTALHTTSSPISNFIPWSCLWGAWHFCFWKLSGGSLFLAGWLLMGSPFLRYLIFRSLYSAKCCSFIDFPDSKYLSTSLVSFFSSSTVVHVGSCYCSLLM